MFVKQLFTSNPASFYWGYSQYSCLYFPITHLSSHPEEMESARNNGQIGVQFVVTGEQKSVCMEI